MRLALMSIASRYRRPRPRLQQGRVSELPPAARDYHAEEALKWAPPGLHYAENASEAFQIDLAKGLYGRQFDAPIAPPVTATAITEAELPGVPYQHILKALAEDQTRADARLRRYLETRPSREIERLSEDDLNDFKELWDFSAWAATEE